MNGLTEKVVFARLALVAISCLLPVVWAAAVRELAEFLGRHLAR